MIGSRRRGGIMLFECLCYIAILIAALGLLQSILIQRFGDAQRALRADRRMAMAMALERRLREDVAQGCGPVEGGNVLVLKGDGEHAVRWHVVAGHLVREAREATATDVERLPWVVERFEATASPGGAVEVVFVGALDFDLDEPVVRLGFVESSGAAR